MAADHFCLRWNNYQSNMVSELDILRSEEYLVDVTLSCEGQKFRAHKVILSACSAYFRNVFKENPCEHPIVILKDVNCEDVEALLSFVYQGVVYVSEKKLASFLQTAELLQIKGLTGAASTLKDESVNEKSIASSVPNKSVVPLRKTLPSVSPPTTPPSKRRKGAPMRICKNEEEEEESDSNSQREDEDNDQTHNSIKLEDMDKRQNSDQQTTGEEASLQVEEEMENDIASNAYPGEESNEGTEEGEVKREDVSTLLERSLVSAATASRSFESQGQYPALLSASALPGNAPSMAESLTPSGSHLAQCGNCPHCGQTYSNQSALKYHVRLMHSDLTNRLCCYLCPRSFVQREQYKIHMWEKHKVRW